MKRFAIIELGTITNIAIAENAINANWVDITEITPSPGTGWSYREGIFIQPEIINPSTQRVLTHLQFRNKFTQDEQQLIDELEVEFETSTLLSKEQKRQLRTGYKNFYAASEVHLDDPTIPVMLSLYVALGYLTENRPNEILS